ncbi:aminotransferase-like protein 7 [Elsinoe australis]|uniref:Aminotransferase-like protein 7 n=1 Tax=Elsinoe australis TaxID=40998 RepID=A0A4U7AQZ0_9PEZI|nr:aminotransferase-like protein 7 [Elsinoe australis]
MVRILKDRGILQKCLAPTTTADLFKPDAALRLPPSNIDVTGFLSREGRQRQPSSLKASAVSPHGPVISLATGRPSVDTYPFEEMTMAFSTPKLLARPYRPETAANDGGTPPEKMLRTDCRRNDPSANIDLSISLSYGYSLGSEQLIQFLTTHISHYHAPPYSDWEVCLTIGNTSALEITFRNFANPGDCVLVERHTYSGMIEAAKPLGLTLIPIDMDSDGLSPHSLSTILSTWADVYGHRPKPKLLYTIPTGQNPTGTTQPLQRRRDILAIAEEHNLLIIEDDPYYYLQYPSQPPDEPPTYFSSYLSLCPSGRVIRLDSTSKILAPGLRLGWLTAPKAIVATYQAAHDLGIVHPSGPSQLLVYKLLSEALGHGGLEEWLGHLARSYAERAAATHGAMERVLGRGRLAGICRWKETRAGMFVWLEVDCGGHAAVRDKGLDGAGLKEVLAGIEEEIHARALEGGVLCCKGSLFTVNDLHALDADRGRELRTNGGKRENGTSVSKNVFFRLTFATVSEEDMGRGIEMLGAAIEHVFGIE